MIRFIIIGLATLGAFIFLGGFVAPKVPALASIAFNVGSFSITWVMLGVCALGFCAYKVTK